MALYYGGPSKQIHGDTLNAFSLYLAIQKVVASQLPLKVCAESPGYVMLSTRLGND